LKLTAIIQTTTHLQPSSKKVLKSTKQIFNNRFHMYTTFNFRKILKKFLFAITFALMPFLPLWAAGFMVGAGHGSGTFVAAAVFSIVCIPLFAIVYSITKKSNNVIFASIPIIINIISAILMFLLAGDKEKIKIYQAYFYLFDKVILFIFCIFIINAFPFWLILKRIKENQK
jgi:hypothetical protein